jgi:hypothetical protein
MRTDIDHLPGDLAGSRSISPGDASTHAILATAGDLVRKLTDDHDRTG